MIHFTNKKTSEVYAYESIEDAERFDDDFDNLVEMTDEQFVEFRDRKPRGGKWTYKGWVIDDELLAEAIAEENRQKLQSLLDKKTSLQADMNMHLLLDEREEAKAIALQLKELNEEISRLQEE